MLRRRLFWPFLALFLAFLYWDVHRGLFELLGHLFFKAPLGVEFQILVEIKLPRILLALLVGGVLSVSGAVMQNIFHNPLIDPYLLGVASGAALGCAVSIGFFDSAFLFFFAFLGALLSSLLIIVFARFLKDSSISLVLVGVIFSAFLSAAAGLIKFFISPDKAQAVVIWLLGSLSLSRYEDVVIVGGCAFVGLFFLWLLRFRLDVLSLGDVQAFSLGVRPFCLRVFSVILISLACSACVSVSGTIGWIGLLMPHFARNLVGQTLGRLFLCALILGAFGLYIADFLAKNLTSVDLPVGSVCALFGAPLLLAFLLKKGFYE